MRTNRGVPFTQLLAMTLVLGGTLPGQQRPTDDSAAYFAFLPSVADLPAGAELVDQRILPGTYVRILKVKENLAVNAAVRSFSSADSAALFMKRMYVPADTFAHTVGDGLRQRGITPDSVRADTIPLGQLSLPFVGATIARFYLPGGVFRMTQAFVGDTRQIVYYQVGGAASEQDVMDVLQFMIRFSATRIAARALPKDERF